MKGSKMKKYAFTLVHKGLLQATVNDSQIEPKHTLFLSNYDENKVVDQDMIRISVTTSELISYSRMLSDLVATLLDAEPAPEQGPVEAEKIKDRVANIVSRNLARSKHGDSK
jgi:hypothetical protein